MPEDGVGPKGAPPVQESHGRSKSSMSPDGNAAWHEALSARPSAAA